MATFCMRRCYGTAHHWKRLCRGKELHSCLRGCLAGTERTDDARFSAETMSVRTIIEKRVERCSRSRSSSTAATSREFTVSSNVGGK